MNAPLSIAIPVIKIAGGKRQLLPEILPRLPSKISTYYEPFIGGGAVFFALANGRCFKRAVLGDSNADLINLYTQLRDKPAAVLAHLRTHTANSSKDYYYEQVDRSLSEGPAGAARFMYLNRACFNGLVRYNQSGQFNTPYGDGRLRAVDGDAIRAASAALQGVKLVCGDFEKLMAKPGVGDATFCDPPYLPVSATSNFTTYGADGFGVADHERLADCVASCVKRGANVLLSNSDTPESRRIFGRGQWELEKVSARRSINSKGDGRGAVGEILVTAPKRSRKVVK